MFHQVKRLLFLLCCMALVSSCSTKKKSFAHRTFHNITARYNGYFYARESIKEGEAKLESSVSDDYNRILPLYKLGTKEQARMVAPEMEKVFKKASRVIQYHSINLRGKEYVRWIDENYIAIGISHYYNQDYYQAAEVFDYVAKTYKDQESRYAAMIWMVRAYNELTLLTKSQFVLDILNNDKELPKEYKDELAIAFADFLIKRESYDLAKQELRKAIELTSRKKKRARLTYILAQIEERTGNKSQAATLYAQVNKLNPTYEMGFQAKMKNAMLADVGERGARELKVQLLKLAKDAKNKEYLDQIYYALAELELKSPDRPQAERYFKMSASNSISNDYQKAMAYLRLADLYFSDPQYRTAFAYYDSTSMVMPEKYPEYKMVFDKRNSLEELVENLEIIEKQDSLLRWATMDESERNRRIDDLIEERTREEERKKAEEEKLRQEALAALNNPSTGASRTAGGMTPTGEWYFYNASQKGLGAAEFTRKWGDRKLADHWRRKNKQTIEFTEAEEFGEDAGPGVAAPWQNRDYYLKDLPISIESQQASRNMMLEAYYNTGNIYREQLQDYNQSILAFEEMNTKFDTGRYYLPGLYQLYRLNLQTQNQPRADHYKQQILSRFPETTYAKLVSNPDYLKEREATRNKIEDYYEETYQGYLAGNYQMVIDNSRTAEVSFQKSPYLPKFALLRSMATGATKGTVAYIEQLEELIANFPSSAEATRAKEILPLLKKEQQAPTAPPVSSSIYSLNFDTSHVAVLLVGGSADVNALKAAISDFNLGNYSAEGYSVKSLLFDDSKQMIVVSGLKDKQKAMLYYYTLDADPIIEGAGADTKLFLLSSENYPIFYKDKNTDAYLEFFDVNYIKAQ